MVAGLAGIEGREAGLGSALTGSVLGRANSLGIFAHSMVSVALLVITSALREVRLASLLESSALRIVVEALLPLSDDFAVVSLEVGIVLFALGKVKSTNTELGDGVSEISLALCSCGVTL